MTADYGDFWVVVGTVAPVTIAADVILIGQSIPLLPYLRRRVGERSFTSWLRERHMWFIGADLVGCLAVIAISLYALWNGSNAASSAWLAACLLLVVLIVLCILAVCTATIDKQKPLNRKPLRVVIRDRPACVRGEKMSHFANSDLGLSSSSPAGEKSGPDSR